MTFQEPYKQPKEKAQEMMDAIIGAGKSGMDPTLKEGWSRISLTTLQFIHPKGLGYGFVTAIAGGKEWGYIIAPNGIDQIQGTKMILESATEEVEQTLNQVTRTKPKA